MCDCEQGIDKTMKTTRNQRNQRQKNKNSSLLFSQSKLNKSAAVAVTL
jgi:hypothetical protein